MSTTRLAAGGGPHPVYAVHGEDAGLVSQELSALLDELCALEPSGVAPLEEYGEAGRDEPFALGPLLDACRTPPFLAERRVLVLRDAGVLNAAQVKELTAYLAAPLATTVLVLAYPGKSAPAAVAKAVRATGRVLDAVPAARAQARAEWFAEHLGRAAVRLDRDATAQLRAHLGEDLARLEGVLGALEAAFGSGATVHVGDLEPFLGSAGGVAPWDLTDAIDSGDPARALDYLHRMLGGGERHPLQLLATLHRHFGAMLRLDGAAVSGEADAAALTKLAPYPAKKALAQARKLGHDKIARAIALLAAADLDVRGGLGWSGELVLEVLVARLARLAGTRPGRARPAVSR